jgi:hypothetical protein
MVNALRQTSGLASVPARLIPENFVKVFGIQFGFDTQPWRSGSHNGP